jgi:hypothetical protein
MATQQPGRPKRLEHKRLLHFASLDDRPLDRDGEVPLSSARWRFKRYEFFLRISETIARRQTKQGFTWRPARMPSVLTLAEDWTLHSVAKPKPVWHLSLTTVPTSTAESIDLIYRDSSGKKQLHSIEDYQLMDSGIITDEDLTELDGLELTHEKHPAFLRKHQVKSLPKEWLDEQGKTLISREAQALGPADRWNFLTPGPNKHRHLKARGQDWAVRCEPWPGNRTFKVGPQKVVFRGLTAEADDVGEVSEATCEISGATFRMLAKPKTLGYRGKGVAVELTSTDEDENKTVDPVRQLLESDIDQLSVRDGKGFLNYNIESKRHDRRIFFLDKKPPEGAVLQPRLFLQQLLLQKRAINQLLNAPLPHHLPLLRLGDNAKNFRPEESLGLDTWTPFAINDDEWVWLNRPELGGTDEQRDFVRKALATPDFALMQGPPGSGKTTAICELIAQLQRQGRTRILLCANTHAAVDNVIDKLRKKPELAQTLDILRMGMNRGDAQTGFDHRRKELQAKGLSKEEAIELVTRMADITCSTVEGLSMHPALGAVDSDDYAGEEWNEPVCVKPFWDIMILDEASKTLLPQFLLPAMLAKRWIVVGDLRQLPPFADESGLSRNIRNCHFNPKDKDDEIYEEDQPWQRAAMVKLALRRAMGDRGFWPLKSLRHEKFIVMLPLLVARELYQQLADLEMLGVFVSNDAAPTNTRKGWSFLRSEDFAKEEMCLKCAMADFVIVDDKAWEAVAEALPAGNHWLELEWHQPATHANLRKRQSFRNKALIARRRTKIDAAHACESANQLLSEEIAWRLNRQHQLREGVVKMANVAKSHEDLNRHIGLLIPSERAAERERIMQAASVAIPSILDALQDGLVGSENANDTIMDRGLIRQDSDCRRFVALSYQHRMHPSISAFPRETIYGQSALQDAQTVRDETTANPLDEARQTNWSYRFPKLKTHRAAWIETGNSAPIGGVNQEEIKAVIQELERFVVWAEMPANRQKDGLPWEVALLSFFVPQVKAIAKALEVMPRLRDRWVEEEKAYKSSAWLIRFNTVDSFQGWEADFVILSMRNVDKTGFMDSPNRLNVASTRGRELLIVVGHRPYYLTCEKSGEKCAALNEFAKRSPLLS